MDGTNNLEGRAIDSDGRVIYSGGRTTDLDGRAINVVFRDDFQEILQKFIKKNPGGLFEMPFKKLSQNTHW